MKGWWSREVRRIAPSLHGSSFMASVLFLDAHVVSVLVPPRVATSSSSSACPCVTMLNSTTPLGLLTVSRKRRDRHKRLAAKKMMDHACMQTNSTGDVDQSLMTADESTLSSVESVESSGTSCDAFYIGEEMRTVSVQTELTTRSCDSLAYCAEPEMLLTAMMHNVGTVLMGHIQDCERRVSDILSPLGSEPVNDIGQAEVCLQQRYDLIEDFVDDGAPQRRLCLLRLEKVVQVWHKMLAKVQLEIEIDDALGNDSFSLLLEEVSELFANLTFLAKSEHSDGTWANGIAVHQLFMQRFGICEGEDAVVEYMNCLGLKVSEKRMSVLQLGLTIMVGNRCDENATGNAYIERL